MLCMNIIDTKGPDNVPDGGISITDLRWTRGSPVEDRTALINGQATNSYWQACLNHEVRVKLENVGQLHDTEAVNWARDSRKQPFASTK